MFIPLQNGERFATMQKVFLITSMPRGQKTRQVVVIYGPKGNIIKHTFHRNKNNVDKEKVARVQFDPVTRQRVRFADVKVKQERHSS